MNEQASAANAVPISRVTVGKATLLRTLMHLWPYIWPSDRRDLKLRVLAATVLLFLAKLATVAASTRSLRSRRSDGQMYGHRCMSVRSSVALPTVTRKIGTAFAAAA